MEDLICQSKKKEEERIGFLMFVTKTWGLKMNGISLTDTENNHWLLTKGVTDGEDSLKLESRHA